MKYFIFSFVIGLSLLSGSAFAQDESTRTIYKRYSGFGVYIYSGNYLSIDRVLKKRKIDLKVWAVKEVHVGALDFDPRDPTPAKLTLKIGDITVDRVYNQDTGEYGDDFEYMQLNNPELHTSNSIRVYHYDSTRISVGSLKIVLQKK